MDIDKIVGHFASKSISKIREAKVKLGQFEEKLKQGKIVELEDLHAVRDDLHAAERQLNFLENDNDWR